MALWLASLIESTLLPMRHETQPWGQIRKMFASPLYVRTQTAASSVPYKLEWQHTYTAVVSLES